jgi:hypothetical protein
MFDALYQDRYKELEQFVRICIMVKKQELIEVLSELDKAKGQYLKISEVFLTYLAQINNMPKQEYELLVDKMVPTFGLDNNKILGCDTPEGMFCIVIKSGDLVEIEEPVDVSDIIAPVIAPVVADEEPEVIDELDGLVEKARVTSPTSNKIILTKYDD